MVIKSIISFALFFTAGFHLADKFLPKKTLTTDPDYDEKYRVKLTDDKIKNN